MILDYIRYSILRYPFHRERLKTKRFKQYLDKEVIFIHIPKAAGSSINMSLYGNSGLGHAKAKDYLFIFGYLKFNAMFKFTFVRNPYSRVQSAYNFLINGGMHSGDKTFARKHINMYKDLNDFIINGLDKSIDIQKGTHFIPQSDFIMINDKVVVNAIGKLENIEQDYKNICNVLGIENELLIENKMQKSDFDYMQTFNDESKRVIQKLYKKDFEIFDYEM